jgi:hypothetical protein
MVFEQNCLHVHFLLFCLSILKDFADPRFVPNAEDRSCAFWPQKPSWISEIAPIEEVQVVILQES